MTTKVKLIQLGQESLAGGDAPAEIRGKYHSAVIEQYLDMAYADILQDQFDTAGNDFTKFDNFAKGYQCTIAYNKETELKYFDLPVTLIPLSPKQAGIRSISMFKGQQMAFAPIQNSSIPMWDELEAMQVDTETCAYMVEENQCVLYKNAPDIGAILLVKVITPFAELKSSDTVYVPGGKNSILFQRMYQFMSLRGNSAEKYNDNTSVQTK